ncbi:hypothetical protein J6590_074136 [Homalodisca vitripennis]|nr:hypothetical protein J6590_074136 [Homalodisca vitripennis]
MSVRTQNVYEAVTWIKYNKEENKQASSPIGRSEIRSLSVLVKIIILTELPCLFTIVTGRGRVREGKGKFITMASQRSIKVADENVHHKRYQHQRYLDYVLFTKHPSRVI